MSEGIELVYVQYTFKVDDNEYKIHGPVRDLPLRFVRVTLSLWDDGGRPWRFEVGTNPHDWRPWSEVGGPSVTRLRDDIVAKVVATRKKMGR